MTFGTALKAWMKRHGMTAKYLAAEVGVTQQSIYNYRYGTSTPRRKTIARILAVFDCETRAHFLAGPNGDGSLRCAQADPLEKAQGERPDAGTAERVVISPDGIPLFEDVGKRICHVCRGHHENSCRVCRLYECARAVLLVTENGMTPAEAVRQAETEAAKGLAAITGKYDQTHDTRGRR